MDTNFGYDGLLPNQRGATVALGNFDGVHLGHRAVIEAARKAVPDVPLGVVTFTPHPRQFFQPDAPGFILTPDAEKTRKLRNMGVDQLYMLSFDAALSAMTPEQFVRDVLVDGLGVKAVTTGMDFHFGAKRAGNAATLRAFGEEFGFAVTTLDGVVDEVGAAYSSSAVREALRAGRPHDAAEILGEPHRITGKVLKGDQRGRTIGFPTANLSLDGVLAPAFGIYAVKVFLEGENGTEEYSGAASIGIRPTYELEQPNLEVFIFDFDRDLYGQNIAVALHDYIRPEAKFDGLEALKDQIARDCEVAQQLLGS